MNQEELEQLINQLNGISIDLNNELQNLQALQQIREASCHTGANQSREYTKRPEPRVMHSQDKGTNKNYNQSNSPGQKRRPKVGDTVRVIRGRNQGATGNITRETSAQYEIRSQQVIKTFRKWKNNVKLTKRKDE